MAILDKKLLLADIEKRLNAYVPADTVRRIIADAGQAMMNYEVTAFGPDGGGGGNESEQLIQLYLDAKSIEGKADSTIALYKDVLGRFAEDIGAPLSRVTVYHLRKHMMAEKARGVSMTTIKSRGYIYSGFYKWLRNEGLIDTDPTSSIGVIKASSEKEIPFSAPEIQLIKEACQNDRHRAIVHFLLSTGCRVSEMCSVNRTDIDFQSLSLTVKGKGDKKRTVYIDDVTALMLKRYLASRKDASPALFVGRKAKRSDPHDIRVILTGIGQRSHVPGVHPHRFRHTLATQLVDRGMSIQEVANILGHSKLDTTMVYVAINQRNTENSYRKYACM